jgi:hypothetical protein
MKEMEMNTCKLSLCSLLLSLILIGTATVPALAVELVHERKSEFVIYHDAASPSSVAMAASELQSYVSRVSGAQLPIVNEPRVPMVCLGDNAASRSEGLSIEDIPVEGFRIVTKAGNIFILGYDTMDNQRTPGGGGSAGTRNGTYTFIERFLGVRWLVPGEHGDYVPSSVSITVPDTDLVDAPFFKNRRVPYTQQGRRDVKRWWARQRLGLSLYLTHSHNWRRTIPASHFDEHPNWFAERGGVRVPPTGRYKLCTTNPGLVRAFADAAIAYFDHHPQATCYSLSPSDSAGFCECEKCLPLYEMDPNGHRSVTPAILTFYNDVARLVARKYPNKLLAGYVYAAYVFPPREPIPLEPNVFLTWAPSFDYGYTLFRPNLQRQWEELLAQWTRLTSNISYYDLPTHILTESGALNPPGLKILEFLYPRLKAANVKGVYVYGIEAWGRGAPLNYLLAKLAWDPKANVEELFDEFCAKAYGRGGDEINRLYRLLDAEVARHFREYSDARYRLTPDMMRDIYAKNMHEIERLYRTAESKVENADSRARLQMIGDNLTLLHWNLRQHRMLDDPTASSFYLPDADFFAFMKANRGSLALQPTGTTATPSYVREQLDVVPAGKPAGEQPVNRFRLRGDQHLVLRPTGDRPVRVKFSRITTRGQLVTYSVFSSDSTEIVSGLMSAEEPIELSPAGSSYYHVVVSAGSASFMVEVTGAAWAVDGTLDDKGLHFLGHLTPIYFHVPKKIATFHLSLETQPPGETAVATLYAPDGRRAAGFDCTSLQVDLREIAVPKGGHGWWQLRVNQAPTGAMDDVWVKLGDELNGFLSLAPTQALVIEVAR